MLDVLSEIYRQRGQAAPDRRGADRSVHTVGYLIDPPDPVTYLCTVSVFDSEPISGVPATSMDYTGITAVHVLLDPFTGRPVHVLGPAGELAFGEVPFERDTRHVVTGHVIPPTSTGTYRADEATWDRYSITTFGGVTDVWQQAASADVIQWTDTAFDTSDATTYTFSGVEIGAADADRVVFFALLYRSTANRSPSTFKVNGVDIYDGGAGFDNNAMRYDSGFVDWRYARIGHLAIPTGTTADFEVTFSSSGVVLAGIVAWRAVGTVAVVSADAGPPSTLITIPSGGFAVSAHYWESADATTGWNITEDSTVSVGDGRNARISAAHSVTAGTDQTIQNTVVSAEHEVQCTVSYSLS